AGGDLPGEDDRRPHRPPAPRDRAVAPFRPVGGGEAVRGEGGASGSAHRCARPAGDVYRIRFHADGSAKDLLSGCGARCPRHAQTAAEPSRPGGLGGHGMRRTVYVTAERLAAELRWQKPPVLLDVRWSLANPDGRAAFAANHLPGAQYVDLETELSGNVGADTGRHPLPEIADLQRAARRWGINDGDAIVCYDDSDGAAAARAWWVLRWAGVENVRILDGGYRAWAGHGIIVSDRYESGRPKRKGRRPRGN